MPLNSGKPKDISGVLFRYNSTSKDWYNQALYNCSDADRDKIEGIFSYQTKVLKMPWFLKWILPYLWRPFVEDQIRVSWNFLNTLMNSGITHARVLKIALAALVSTGMLTDRQHNIWRPQYNNRDIFIEVPNVTAPVTLAFNNEKDALNFIHDVYPLSAEATVRPVK